MKAKAQHTPTPWALAEIFEPEIFEPEIFETYEVGINGGKGISRWDQLARVIVRMNGRKKRDPIGVANANFIIRAVNSHEDLLDLVKEYVPCNCDQGQQRWSNYKCQKHLAIEKAERKVLR